MKASAVAQIDGHREGQPLYVGEEYRLYAGILQEPPADFVHKPIELPDMDIVEVDVAVFAQDMDVSPHWVQKLHFFRDRDAGLLEFCLKPKVPGHKSIRIDFYYERHWLQSLEIEVDVREAKQMAVTIQDAISGTTHSRFVSEKMTVQQMVQALLSQTDIPLLESQESRLAFRLVFRGYLLSQEATLAEIGIQDGAELILVAETRFGER